MAVLLKPFGIKTNQNVRRGRQQAKGFHASAFADAFSNYLPLEKSHRSQGPNPGNPPVSDDRGESHDRSHEGARPNGSGTGTVGAAGGTDAGTDAGTDDFGLKAAEMAAGTDGTDSSPLPREHRGGNGPAPGLHCGYCTMAFLPGDEPVEIDGKVYHCDDACAGTIRRRRAAAAASPPPPQPSPPPAGKRSRIKGADTTPGVEKLPPDDAGALKHDPATGRAPDAVLAPAMRRAKKDPVATLLAAATTAGVRFRISGADLQVAGPAAAPRRPGPAAPVHRGHPRAPRAAGARRRSARAARRRRRGDHQRGPGARGARRARPRPARLRHRDDADRDRQRRARPGSGSRRDGRRAVHQPAPKDKAGARPAARPRRGSRRSTTRPPRPSTSSTWRTCRSRCSRPLERRR